MTLLITCNHKVYGKHLLPKRKEKHSNVQVGCIFHMNLGKLPHARRPIVLEHEGIEAGTVSDGQGRFLRNNLGNRVCFVVRLAAL